MLRITVVLLANNAVNMQQFANNAAIIKTVNSAKNSAIAELQKAGGSKCFLIPTSWACVGYSLIFHTLNRTIPVQQSLL